MAAALVAILASLARDYGVLVALKRATISYLAFFFVTSLLVIVFRSGVQEEQEEEEETELNGSVEKNAVRE